MFEFLKKKPKVQQKSEQITVKAKPIIPLPTPPPVTEPKLAAPPKPKAPTPRPPKEKPLTEREQPKKEFMKVFKRLTYRHRSWDIWKDFIVMFACTLSNPVDKNHYDKREALYMRTIKKYSKEEQSLFPELVAETVMALEDNLEQDFLGDIFMDLNLGNEAGGQFFTPYYICELMAKLVGGDTLTHIKTHGYLTISDPCCGAGGLLIAGVHEVRQQLKDTGFNFQNHILVAAQDIDQTTALMCYIQLSLIGIAAYIKVGDSLREPMSPLDTMENYWFTPMYFLGVWPARRILKGEI